MPHPDSLIRREKKLLSETIDVVDTCVSQRARERRARR